MTREKKSADPIFGMSIEQLREQVKGFFNVAANAAKHRGDTKAVEAIKALAKPYPLANQSRAVHEAALLGFFIAVHGAGNGKLGQALNKAQKARKAPKQWQREWLTEALEGKQLASLSGPTARDIYDAFMLAADQHEDPAIRKRFCIGRDGTRENPKPYKFTTFQKALAALSD